MIMCSEQSHNVGADASVKGIKRWRDYLTARRMQAIYVLKQHINYYLW